MPDPIRALCASAGRMSRSHAPGDHRDNTVASMRTIAANESLQTGRSINLRTLP